MTRLQLAALATAQFLVVLSTSIVNVALPQVRSGLGLSPAGLSWVVNAYVLVFGALLLLGGRAGDVFGLRRVFLAGTGLFAVSSLAAALAAGPVLLIAARAAQGVGAALLAPTALALVLTLFTGPQRGMALGVWGAVSGAGGAAGVLLGGVLTDAFGWRSVFVVMAPLAVAVLVATWLLVPADQPRGGRLDIPGAATVTVGLVALTYGLGNSWIIAVAGLVLLGVFVVLQRRSADPLVPGRIFTRSVAAANVLMTLLGAMWLGLFYFLPLYQQRVLGDTPLETGLSQLPLALTITVASWATPRIRMPVRTVLFGGLAVLAVGLAWLSTGVLLLGSFVFIGAGLGVAFVQLTALSSAGVPAADSGLAGGLVNATRQIGGALGLAPLSLLPGFGPVFLTCAVLTLLTGLLSAVLLPAERINVQ